MAKYDMSPIEVPPVETKYRSIKTPLPVPESLPMFESLANSEPQAMAGMPPMVWQSARGFSVEDPFGNRWIDWSSGVLVTNAGHGHPKIKAALLEQIESDLLASYVFVHKKRAELTGALQKLGPRPDSDKVFLLSTGSEATECCIKLARTYGLNKHGAHKKIFVSFNNAFHGRTMGAQLAGGLPGLKTWMGPDLDLNFVQAPFPDGYKNPDTSFELFLSSLAEQGVEPNEICGVMSESYQGGGPDFLPVEYAKQLQDFCRRHDALLIMDEVQSGFGRTGKMFCYELYGMEPDLVACGKGISSSLPLSAVIGRKDVMDLYPPGSMTSTHSASPLCVAAALASLEAIQDEGLVENAAELEKLLMPALYDLQQKHPRRIGAVTGKGLVAGLQMVHPGGKEPDPKTALAINLACFHKGLLMFAPVGPGGECVKIAPPLCITEEALTESIEVLREAVEEVLGA